MSEMDEQQSMFYFTEFYENPNEIVKQAYYPQSSIQYEHMGIQPLTLKAFNPYEFAQQLPIKQKQKYLHMINHNKTYAGLTHFFNFQKTEQIPQFFSQFKCQDYQNKDWIQNPLHLQQFFDNRDAQTLKRKLQQVERQIHKISNKTFSTIHINHTILPSFQQHFDNYRYLNSHVNFIKDLQINLIYFIDKMKQLDQDSDLIVKIYQFWMQTFQNFVLTIKKHTERYTLNMVKKNKDIEAKTNINYEGKSTSSSRMIQSQKRKAWKPNQLQLLQKVILSNSAINQTTINKVAQQLNRTPASVSSKIQKIIKDHKNHNPDYEVHENMTLLDKVINVLKNYQNGLSRESVIQRVKQHYQMGYDMNWSKSVAQLLSSRPEFVKIKGTYSLNGFHKFDISKKTFKDKVVNCLLAIPEQKADLKRLVDKYIELYGTSEGISILSQQRRKIIEGSISKSLCRYDIFNKQKSKTVYKLRQFCGQRAIDQEIDGFLS